MIAAYSLSAAVAGVVGGRWSDRHPSSTKTLCLMCITAMVVGNLQYLIGSNVWNVVISRFICGELFYFILFNICHIFFKFP
jgi:MFS family permease